MAVNEVQELPEIENVATTSETANTTVSEKKVSFSIADFRSVAKEGFQKLTRYSVDIPIPPILVGNTEATNTDRHLQFYCDSADFAGLMFQMMPIFRYGYGILEKKPVATVMNDIMLTFYNDGKSNNLRFFHDWFAAISNFSIPENSTIQGQDKKGKSVYEFAFKDDYVVTPRFTLFNTAEKENISIFLRGFYPVHLQETKLSWSLGSDIMRVVGIFAFTDWYRPDMVVSSTTTQPFAS